MSLDVSMHAYERFCERVLNAPASAFGAREKAEWLDYIAKQAEVRYGVFSPSQSWRKHIREATYVVKGLTVVSVLPPGRTLHTCIPLTPDQERAA